MTKLRLLGDHMQPNPRRVLGPQTAGTVQCKVHGEHHPSNENCPLGEGYGACRPLARAGAPTEPADEQPTPKELPDDLDGFYWA